MKKITLLGAAPIDGVMHYPSQGPLEVSPAIADELVKAGLAKVDDLDKAKVADVRATATAEGVDIGPEAPKAEVVAAIREHRVNKA